MDARRMPRFYVTATCFLCGLVCLVAWYSGQIPLPVFAESGEQATIAEDQATEQAPPVTQVWDSVNTTGVEEELVETIFDADKDSWTIVGERGFGIAMYGAPEFQVPMRKWEDIPMFPCSDCHKKLEINYTPRQLKEKHADLVVDHGNDRFWCTACHDGKGMDFLASKDGRRIDMDHGYLHCGECHFKAHKDWEYGVHGLRIGMWQGTRVLRTCTECHDAHRPQTVLETPVPAPVNRANLQQFGNPVAVHE
jgi:hypothetical protein